MWQVLEFTCFFGFGRLHFYICWKELIFWCILRWQPHTVRLEHKTLKLLKYWTWQFVVIRPVCSILIIALQLLGMYPSWVSWTFTIILNISVSMALYALVLFYHLFAKELAPHKPLAKFLCIKGIVFFSFWQVNHFDLNGMLFRIIVHGFWILIYKYVWWFSWWLHLDNSPVDFFSES